MIGKTFNLNITSQCCQKTEQNSNNSNTGENTSAKKAGTVSIAFFKILPPDELPPDLPPEDYPKYYKYQCIEIVKDVKIDFDNSDVAYFYDSMRIGGPMDSYFIRIFTQDESLKDIKLGFEVKEEVVDDESRIVKKVLHCPLFALFVKGNIYNYFDIYPNEQQTDVDPRMYYISGAFSESYGGLSSLRMFFTRSLLIDGEVSQPLSFKEFFIYRVYPV